MCKLDELLFRPCLKRFSTRVFGNSGLSFQLSLFFRRKLFVNLLHFVGLADRVDVILCEMADHIENVHYEDGLPNPHFIKPGRLQFERVSRCATS